MPHLLVQIAVPYPLRQAFTYHLPSTLRSPDVAIGERVLVPFANRQVIGVVVGIQNKAQLPSKIKAVLTRYADQHHLPADICKLLHVCSSYYHQPIGEVFKQALPVLLRKISQQELQAERYWFLQEGVMVEHACLSKSAIKQRQLLKLLEKHPALSWVELRTLGFTKIQLNNLVKKGLIYDQAISPIAYQWHPEQLNLADIPVLSTEQASACNAIHQQLDHYACHLLEGVTGSGKTEVYLQLIAKVLATNKQALMLVPEIGLTPQTLRRFEQRFNVPIYLHHSGMNDNERLQTWLAAKQQHAAIILGTRSAVFTPAENLALIIVDEEHDLSLKQQDGFRYHARDIAILRAKQLNIPIVLGSATPSFETLHNALIGKYTHYQLTERPGKSTFASMQLIDMNTQIVEQGISASLKQAITTTLGRGEQVLVFLNRRGYAPAISCQECHHVVTCRRCNKPYTYHKSKQLLICHHCNSQKRLLKQCDHCGSVRLFPLGQGTEQLEQQLTTLFPDYATVRIDRDSTSKKGALSKLLQQVADHKYQLLIGTQMLAKGHHFPNVTLVALLDVDGALFSYDYRAPEHLAQLLVQVSGRAGRAEKHGKVLIQSYYPQHPLLQGLVHSSYGEFARQALGEREQALLPPFSHQVLLRAEATIAHYAEQFLSYFTGQQFDNCLVAGPLPAPGEKKAGKFCYHLFLQATQRSALHQALRTIITLIPNNEWTNKVRWSIDVDPLDLTW